MKLAQIILDHPAFKGLMIDFFRNNIPEYEFDFYVMDKNVTPILNGYLSDVKENVVFRRISTNQEESLFVNEILDRYDYVLFHSMMLSPQTKASIVAHNKSNIKKIVWIEWGYDLFVSRGTGFVDFLRFVVKRFMQKWFDRKIPYFVAIHPSDMLAYKKLVNGNVYVNWVPYREKPNPSFPLEGRARVYMHDKLRLGKPIVIQIGQRAWKGLNHSKWLRRLSVYKHENIKILLPLSYGDKIYGDQIQKESVSIFGEKAIVLRDLLPLEEYNKLLNDVDIFILDSKRQIALGNIHPLLRNQKKLFLPPDGTLYQYFHSYDISVCDINLIGRVPFSEFVKDLDMSKAVAFMNQYDTFDNVARWRKILSDITKLYE